MPADTDTGEKMTHTELIGISLWVGAAILVGIGVVIGLAHARSEMDYFSAQMYEALRVELDRAINVKMRTLEKRLGERK